LQQAGVAEGRQIEAAYELAYARKPSANEMKLASEFLGRQREIIAERVNKKEPVALPTGSKDLLSAADGAALVDFCHMLLNSNEFVYLN
jgi:hypothetical protein